MHMNLRCDNMKKSAELADLNFDEELMCNVHAIIYTNCEVICGAQKKVRLHVKQAE